MDRDECVCVGMVYCLTDLVDGRTVHQWNDTSKILVKKTSVAWTRLLLHQTIVVDDTLPAYAREFVDSLCDFAPVKERVKRNVADHYVSLSFVQEIVGRVHYPSTPAVLRRRMDVFRGVYLQGTREMAEVVRELYKTSKEIVSEQSDDKIVELYNDLYVPQAGMFNAAFHPRMMLPVAAGDRGADVTVVVSQMYEWGTDGLIAVRLV